MQTEKAPGNTYRVLSHGNRKQIGSYLPFLL